MGSLAAIRWSVFAPTGAICSGSGQQRRLQPLSAPGSSRFNGWSCHAARNRNSKKRLLGLKVFAVAQAADVKSEGLTELAAGQVQEFHQLPSGLKLEVIVQNAGKNLSRKGNPLVFIHGSMHAAWCWAVHWMPFFSARGYDCYAVSFLAQGASDAPETDVAGTLDSHAKDIGHFIRSRLQRAPVLIAHSLGGLVAQWYLSNSASASSIAGNGLGGALSRPAAVVLACSAPPSGNSSMVMRFLKKDLLASFKITLGFASKLGGPWAKSLARDLFFSRNFPENELQEYLALLQKSSRAPLVNLRGMNDSLPVPAPPPDAPSILVLHAENDYLVDVQGSEETAQWSRTKPVIVPYTAHDLMLDLQWEQAAGIVNSWLDENLP